MRKKIAGLVLTISSLLFVTYFASTVGNDSTVGAETLDVDEMGLHSTNIEDERLLKLIKQYEYIHPVATPWETCQP